MVSKSKKGELNVIGRGEDEKRRSNNSYPLLKKFIKKKIPENKTSGRKNQSYYFQRYVGGTKNKKKWS